MGDEEMGDAYERAGVPPPRREETFQSSDDRRSTASGIRHKYRELSPGEKIEVDALKDAGQAFWDRVHKLTMDFGDRPGSARSYALAKTKIEEAVFWSVHGLTNPEPLP